MTYDILLLAGIGYAFVLLIWLIWKAFEDRRFRDFERRSKRRCS